jgi:hypothetical protein
MQTTTHDAADDDEPGNPYFSPTLIHLEHGLGEPVPGDDIACRDCPLSIWHWTKSKELLCRCSAMHKDTWGPGATPVLFCDAREQAVRKLIADLSPQRS